MNWHKLESKEAVDALKAAADTGKALILKHSTRCSISAMALDRLERSWVASEMEGLETYYLDLIRHRDVSNYVSETFGVQHESPQVLLIDKGECVYHESHLGINYDGIKSHL